MPTPVLLFFNISSGELLIILLVAFVVFGPSKIPEIARKVGRGISEVRRASDEIKREITKETRKMESSLSVDDLDLKNTRRPVKKADSEKPIKEDPEEDTKPQPDPGSSPVSNT